MVSDLSAGQPGDLEPSIRFGRAWYSYCSAFGLSWWALPGVYGLHWSLKDIGVLVERFIAGGQEIVHGVAGRGPGRRAALGLSAGGLSFDVYQAYSGEPCVHLSGEDDCDRCGEPRTYGCDCPDVCQSCGSRTFEPHLLTCEATYRWGHVTPWDWKRSGRNLGSGPTSQECQDRYDLQVMMDFGVRFQVKVAFAQRSSLNDRELRSMGLTIGERCEVKAWRAGAVSAWDMPEVLGINRAAFNCLNRSGVLPPSCFRDKYGTGTGWELEPMWAQSDLAALRESREYQGALEGLPFPVGSDAELPARFTTGRLRERGWTKTMNDRFLGNADLLVENPYYRRGPEMTLYDVDRVFAAEMASEFATAKARAESRSMAARKGQSGK